MRDARQREGGAHLVKRILMVLAVALVMAAMMAATAAPAFAVPPDRPQPASEKASCVGQGATNLNTTYFPGIGGLVAAGAAQENIGTPGLSDVATRDHSCPTTLPPPE
jgi:hypothetical protein